MVDENSGLVDSTQVHSGDCTREGENGRSHCEESGNTLSRTPKCDWGVGGIASDIVDRCDDNIR